MRFEMKRLIVAVGAVIAGSVVAAGLPTRDVPYVTEGDAYRIARCKLDLRIPSETGFPTVVWFHGGNSRTEGFVMKGRVA